MMELKIDRAEALRYLRCPPDGALRGAVERCCTLLERECVPRTVWRRFDPASPPFPLPGEAIRALLDGCTGALAFCATLGSEADALLRRMRVRDMAQAVVLDACASAAAEAVCDGLCAALVAGCAPLYLTDRFSPGYGDLPLSVQEGLCRFLDTQRRVGVTLTEGGLMLPQKSVTAIVGLAPAPRRHRRGCAGCGHYENCDYRKGGTHCGTN